MHSCIFLLVAESSDNVTEYYLLFQVIMHRKYLKGKRNNKERQANIAGKSKMVQSDIPQVPEFLSRVANIPVVHTAIDYASDAYGKAKVEFIILILVADA